jgi:hypothetical protein
MGQAGDLGLEPDCRYGRQELFRRALLAAAGELQIAAVREVGIARSSEAEIVVALRRPLQVAAGTRNIGIVVEPEVALELEQWSGVGKVT